MGTWAPTILGGDEQLDCILDFARRFGGMGDDWNDWDSYPDQLKANLESATVNSMLRYVETSGSGVAAQCIAVAHMAVGAKLPAVLPEKAIEATLAEEVEGWKNPDQRRFYLDTSWAW